MTEQFLALLKEAVGYYAAIGPAGTKLWLLGLTLLVCWWEWKRRERDC